VLAVVTGLSMVRNDIGVVIAGRNFRNYIDTATVQQNNYNWEQLVRTEHWSRRQWLAKYYPDRLPAALKPPEYESQYRSIKATKPKTPIEQRPTSVRHGHDMRKNYVTEVEDDPLEGIPRHKVAGDHRGAAADVAWADPNITDLDYRHRTSSGTPTERLQAQKELWLSQPHERPSGLSVQGLDAKLHQRKAHEYLDRARKYARNTSGGVGPERRDIGRPNPPRTARPTTARARGSSNRSTQQPGTRRTRPQSARVHKHDECALTPEKLRAMVKRSTMRGDPLPM